MTLFQQREQLNATLCPTSALPRFIKYSALPLCIYVSPPLLPCLTFVCVCVCAFFFVCLLFFGLWFFFVFGVCVCACVFLRVCICVFVFLSVWVFYACV